MDRRRQDVKPFEELSYLGQIRRLRRVARAALGAFGMTGARLKFIARSENTTFRREQIDGWLAYAARHVERYVGG
jgi:hypothetical protein